MTPSLSYHKETPKKQSGAQAIVEVLERESISHVFCVPGESYLPIMDAIYDSDDVRLISSRHESGACFMAEGFAKASGKPGVVMATRGVGAANLSIGVHTAYQDSTPLVVMLGQVHSQYRGREGFQEVDLDRFFQPITKWAYEIRDGKRIPEIMQRAIRVAQSGRPGPVVLSLPEDILKSVHKMTFGPGIKKPNPSMAYEDVTEVETLISEAKSPLIIAGGGVKSSDAEEELRLFVEQTRIPVMSAFRRHDVLPNDHELYTGHLGLGTNKNLLKIVKQADLIIALGTRLSEVTTQGYSIISDEQQLIHIDISSDVIGKVYPPTIGIQADLKEALKKLNQLQIQPTWAKWSNECRSIYEEASTMKLTTEQPLNSHIISSMQQHLPNDSIITNDAGNFAGWLHAYFQFKEKKSYIGPTSGAMGYGLPAAIGAKLARPNRPVISLSGDGGFMMTVQEIETACRYGIPVISVVFNNRMYGTIRMHQEIHFPNKVIGTDLGTVNFVDLANSLGADGYLVNDLESFEYALLNGLQAKRPVVIEVQTDPEQISVSSTIDDLRKNE
ncbi:thiamine pyrophosphate-dependent enzyme [Alkalibacillus aidingensis]|uniref:thiamine pyrophosphate-dependent enzyme n=1 Tax=Alkalibacillus aidingensis TaxID=2747607 RepID=UPI001660D022|nr:thiamine pyrophosphate-dependent enzyme [Alkalibacillus aidingensis]